LCQEEAGKRTDEQGDQSQSIHGFIILKRGARTEQIMIKRAGRCTTLLERDQAPGGRVSCRCLKRAAPPCSASTRTWWTSKWIFIAAEWRAISCWWECPIRRFGRAGSGSNRR